LRRKEVSETSDLTSDIRCAKISDIDSAKSVLRHAAEYMKNRMEMPDELQEYLQHCFEQILNDISPDRALNLKKKQGPCEFDTKKRYRQVEVNTFQRNIYIAKDVHRLLPKHNNNLSSAALEVGEENYLGASSIEKIYRKNKAFIIKDNEDFEEFKKSEEYKTHLKEHQENHDLALFVVRVVKEIELNINLDEAIELVSKETGYDADTIKAAYDDFHEYCEYNLLHNNYNLS
jgi:hypothetical protein